MSDPTPTPTPPVPAGPLHSALDWAKQQAAGLVHVLSSIRLSTAAAEVAPIVEAAFEVALPPALAAGERAVADVLTPEHVALLVKLLGEINAAVVHQFLARVPADTTPARTAP